MPESDIQIAEALTRLATIAEKWFERDYQENKGGTNARVTVLESAQDKELQETIQGFGPHDPTQPVSTLSEWKDIGPREREFLARAGPEKGS